MITYPILIIDRQTQTYKAQLCKENGVYSWKFFGSQYYSPMKSDTLNEAIKLAKDTGFIPAQSFDYLLLDLLEEPEMAMESALKTEELFGLSPEDHESLGEEDRLGDIEERLESNSTRLKNIEDKLSRGSLDGELSNQERNDISEGAKLGAALAGRGDINDVDFQAVFRSVQKIKEDIENSQHSFFGGQDRKSNDTPQIGVRTEDLNLNKDDQIKAGTASLSKADQIRTKYKDQPCYYVMSDIGKFDLRTELSNNEDRFDLRSEELKLWQVLILVQEEELTLDSFETYNFGNWTNLGWMVNPLSTTMVYRFCWDGKSAQNCYGV